MFTFLNITILVLIYGVTQFPMTVTSIQTNHIARKKKKKKFSLVPVPELSVHDAQQPRGDTGLEQQTLLPLKPGRGEGVKGSPTYQLSEPLQTLGSFSLGLVRVSAFSRWCPPEDQDFHSGAFRGDLCLEETSCFW